MRFLQSIILVLILILAPPASSQTKSATHTDMQKSGFKQGYNWVKYCTSLYYVSLRSYEYEYTDTIPTLFSTSSLKEYIEISTNFGKILSSILYNSENNFSREILEAVSIVETELFKHVKDHQLVEPKASDFLGKLAACPAMVDDLQRTVLEGLEDGARKEK